MKTGPGIVMYTSKTCPSCGQAKKALNMNNLPYEEISVEGNQEMINWLAMTTGQKTVPQIFVNGNYIGSTPQMFNLMKTGEFSRFL